MRLDRILFVDIDGPMIPATQILIDPMSAFDRKFPPTTIAVLNVICKRTDAKIVFNSSHNNPSDVDDIEVAIVNHGLDPSYIHPTDLKTRYPILERRTAIHDWLSRHPEVEEDWFAVDDVLCAEADHMVLVNPASGLDVDHANRIIGAFGGIMINIF